MLTPGMAIWVSNGFGMALIYHMTFGPKVLWFKSNQAPHNAIIRHRKKKTLPPLYILNKFTPGMAIGFSNTYGMALIYNMTFALKVT